MEEGRLGRRGAITGEGERSQVVSFHTHTASSRKAELFSVMVHSIPSSGPLRCGQNLLGPLAGAG